MSILYNRQGGEGSDLLVLIHGLGATSAVWQPMLESVEKYWGGRWMAPDLPGHGQSLSLQSYSLEELADSVARTIEAAGFAGNDITLVGHSLGGVVGLALAADNQTITPKRMLGLGIKVEWSAKDVEGMSKRAQSPSKHWQSRDEAIEIYRKASGLFSVASDSPLLSDGIREDGDGWRLAADPLTFSVGPPSARDLVQAAQCPCHLACGCEDSLVTVEQLRQYDPQAEVFSGLGHNAMVEGPDVIWDWIARKTS